MLAEFKHTLRRFRGQILGWGIGLFLYGWMMTAFWDSMSNIGDQFQILIQSYPEEILAFFPSIYEFTTPKGYLDTYYFGLMPLIVAIFAIGAGANLLAGDEEKGILDLALAYPISRTGMFFGRLLGFLTALALVMLASWLGWLMPSTGAQLGLSPGTLLLPFIPMFALMALFAAFALLMSMLLPSARMASALSGALMVANYLLIGMSSIRPSLEKIYKATPFYFHQGAAAIDGLDLGWLGGLLGVTAILALLAWWRFLRRDIRVGGEGGWRIARLRLRKKREAPA
ncbi:MAG: ABC transporter permease subunit [Anaerolineales bacterium]|jgi:ABC-2 type transport system permease protein